jgi:hypothetical protein
MNRLLMIPTASHTAFYISQGVLIELIRLSVVIFNPIGVQTDASTSGKLNIVVIGRNFNLMIFVFLDIRNMRIQANLHG